MTEGPVTEDEALTAILAAHGAGAGWAAGRLPTRAVEAAWHRPEGLTQAVDLLAAAMAGLGATVHRADRPSGEVWLSGAVGSGFLRLNPTLLAVVVRAADGGGADVAVRAVAKEGLVDQRSAAKAVDRLRRALP